MIDKKLRNLLPRVAAAVLTVSALVWNSDSAHALSLVPIAQDFAPSGRLASQTFRLENDSTAQVAVSVKIVTRDMTVDGGETNSETPDFTVFTAQVVIPARQSQVVRVQWHGTAAPDRELAYRIIAEQQAIRTELAPNSRAIQLVVRYAGAVYVVPNGARPRLTLESARAVMDANNQRGLELVFNNAGKSHTLIDDPELTLTSGGVTKTFTSDQLQGIVGENVLAESKRRFLVPWPADLQFADPTADFRYVPLR